MSEDEKVNLAAELRDVIFACLTEYTKGGVVQCNLDAEAARENLSDFIVTYLAPKIEEYEDEINSLQFMLEELKNSQAALGSPEFKKELSDSINLQMARLKMMQNMKGDIEH